MKYLQQHRDALHWKLDGVSERDIRWPMTPTGTNLLGIVKHVASVEFGYFGGVFGRPSGEPLPWFEDGAPDNADMWATADESRQSIVDLYHRALVHTDRTIDEFDLDAPGFVPWWQPELREVTLHRVLVHIIAETARHVGHADILRELIDREVGVRADNSNVPEHDVVWWGDYVETLQRAAEAAARG